MTPEDEAAIRARLEAATPGPWEHARVPFRDTASHSIKRGKHVLALVGWEREEAERAPVDAEFIAHARTDVERLLAALGEARAEVEHVSAARAKPLLAALDREAHARQAAESALAAAQGLHQPRECRVMVARWEPETYIGIEDGTWCDTCDVRYPRPTSAALATPTTPEETPTRAEALVEGIERLIEQCEGRPQVTPRLPAALRLLLNTYHRPPAEEN